MCDNYLESIFKLNGKVVLVTGATGQLGYAICESYIRAGTIVIGLDKSLDKEKMFHSERCYYYEVDILNKDSVIALLSDLFSRFNRLDVLVNNAGVSCFEPFEERSEESFEWVMNVNLKGTFLCIQSYVNSMKERGLTGNIINIGSIYGVISPDYRIYTDCSRKNSEVYGATKAAVIQMTRYFATHLAEYNIRVNCISPGGIYNPENPQGKDFIKNYSLRCPMKRMANAEEMLGAILYLSSDAASYTTGQNIVVDGGMSAW